MSATKINKRMRLDLETKLAVLRCLEMPGMTQEKAAEKFNVGRSTITNIFKQKQVIVEAASMPNSNVARKKIATTPRVSILSEMVHQWHVSVEIDAPDLNVTGEVLKAKALSFRDKILESYSENLTSADVIALKAFAASNGWLEKYSKRVGTSSRRRCGEHSSVSHVAIERRLQEIRELLRDVPLQDILNIDESAFQHRTTSSRSYCTANNDGRGVKRSKDRITVTPIVSATGEKFTVQIIGKSARPRALKNVPDINHAFGVHYDSQSKAWQDTSSYLRLLHRINRIAKNDSRTFYILQDNCSSHIAAAKILDPHGSADSIFSFEHLVLIFFPPNATSDCQPLDQGIIRSFKAAFRRCQLSHLLNEYESWCQSDPLPGAKFPINDHTHMRNVLVWVRTAYDAIDSNLIRRCFVKANCLPAMSNVTLNQDIDRRTVASCESDDAVNQLVSIISDLQMENDLCVSLGVDGDNPLAIVNEILQLDEHDPTGDDNVDDDDIVRDILVANNIVQDDEKDGDDEYPLEFQVSDANSAIKTLLNFLPSDSTLPSELRYQTIACLSRIRRPLLMKQKKDRIEGLRQSSLRDYFAPLQRE